MFNPVPAASPGSQKAAFLQYFSQKVPEFLERRQPSLDSPRWQPYHRPERTANPGDTIFHYTVSYIDQQSANLPRNIFDTFVLNSKFVSVLMGAEGGNVRDEDQIYETESYFQATCTVPTLQVKLANLKRAYALLAVRPLPEFNRFPVFLQHAISLLYEKSAKKILVVMRENYEIAAEIVTESLRAAIMKIEDELPKWHLYMISRNNLLASKPFFMYSNEGAAEAIRGLTLGATICIGDQELWTILFMRAFCEKVYASQSLDLFFEVIERPKIELLMMRTLAAALLLIPALTRLFGLLDAQFERLMHDELSLRARDRFLIRVAEKMIGIDELEADRFIHSDAPLSMRLFFEYAVLLQKPAKELPPQKLNFATYLGFSLMKEIDTFCALLNSMWISGEFIALCDLYFERANASEIDYVREATQILQGREIVGIAKTEGGDFVVRRVGSRWPVRLSASFSFWLDSPVVTEDAPANREGSESMDDGETPQ
jgi:hypothetical protein